MARKKIIRIGFDLDGVLVDKPPLVPKKLIELFFKGSKKGLSYRFPNSRLEQWIRKFSHFYLFRPPIGKNISSLKELAKKDGCELYLISSRYSFLEKETYCWLKKRKLDGLFKKIIINLEDAPPHIFKEKQLGMFSIDVYFEDDELIFNFLRKKIKKTKIFLVRKKMK